MSRTSFLARAAGLVVLSLFSIAAQAAVITVDTTLDTIALDATVSLREALTSINNQADINADVTVFRVGGYASLPGGTPDVINFDILAPGVQTISALAAEPVIVMPLTVNGYSQPSSSANTAANSDNAVILIRLDGTGAGGSVDGLTLGAGSAGSTIRGLDITNFAGHGIVLKSNANTIVGNFVGVDPTGTMRMPNGTFPSSGDGIRIVGGSNNQIGSTAVADRNIVSGNALGGIHIIGTLAAPATGNMIQGNFVGTAADGASSVGNRTEPAPAPGAAEGNNLFGIEISGGNNNTVGGTVAGARNVIGFNADGIDVNNGAQQNVLQGNFIGVGANGTTPTGNLLHGIALRSSNGFNAPLGPAQTNEPGVSLNLIGGTVAGAGNLIEFNGTAGVAVFGNPVSASGQANVGNTIEGNSIFENARSTATRLGIDLSNGFMFPTDDGLTANDSKGHAAPNAPNNFQNFPVLTSVIESGGQTTIVGTLAQSVSPNTTFRIEFFANDTDPLNRPVEGQQFLGFVNATTDAGGSATINTTLPLAVAIGRNVTATATDPNGNTSEFSAATVASPLITLAPATLPGGTYGTVYPNPTITASGGTGPYTFAVTTGTLPTGLTLSSGGTLSGTPTGVSTFAFTVTATDAGGYKGSQAYSVAIAQASQTITFSTIPPATPVVGGSYAVAATASSALPVTFSIDATSTPGACSISTNNVSFLAVGTCVVDADQAGDANFLAAPQVKQTMVIGKTSSSTALASSLNPSMFGQAVTFTATVTPTSGSLTPTGTVSFADGATPLCSNIILAAGSATCTVSTLTVASHSISVSYSGNAAIAASTATLTQVVNKKTTTVTLSATPSPAPAGVPVTITATVSGDPPTGTVSFSDNGVTLGCSPVTLVPGATSSTASCSVLLVGASHSIVAVYSGDANFSPATSSALALSVGAAVAAPMLDRWGTLLLVGLLSAIVFVRSRKTS